MKRYEDLKNFEEEYSKKGAYHREVKGFRGWFLEDNYKALAKECHGATRVLDMACGEGVMGTFLDCKELVGVDYSHAAIRLNRETAKNRYAELYTGDMRDLSACGLKGSFSHIICSLSLMYILRADLPFVLKSVHGLLAEGAAFISTYPTVGPMRESSHEADELKPAELKSLLEENGFRVTKMMPICPFLPKDLYEKSLSENDADCSEAFCAYEKAKEALSVELSYHFLCRAEKIAL